MHYWLSKNRLLDEDEDENAPVAAGAPGDNNNNGGDHKKHNPWARRPLSFIIGTKEFLEEDYVGLYYAEESSAVNVFQGRTGSENLRVPNSEVKCQFVLDMAYQGTCLVAIANHRTQIYLTLVGGGIFGNKKEWIFDAIISAHHKWGISGQSSLEQVTLVAFNPRDMGNLTEMLRVYNIPFRVEEKEGSEEDMMEEEVVLKNT